MILSRHIIDLVGWTLLHFLWQGAAGAALYALAARALPRRSANARYLTSCAALLLLACCPVVTFGVLSRTGDASARNREVLAATNLKPAPQPGFATAQAAAIPGRSFSAHADAITVPTWQSGTERLESALPWLALGWLIGVLTLSIRLLLGWIEVGRIRKQSRSLPDHPLRKALADLALRLGVKRPVEIAESDRVDVPAIIGWLKPLALIPVGALLWMGSEELEALIAHELAHVRRCDYAVNLAQSLIETLLFYHPAVWWISGQIRSEREACCDDMAVAAVGNRVVYARALAALAENTSPRPALAMAASGGSAIRRIRRVLGKPEQGREPLSGWIAGALAATILLAAALPFHQASRHQRPTAAIRTLSWKSPAAAVRFPPRSAVMKRPAPGVPAIQVLAPSTSLRKETSLPLSSARVHASTWPALAPLVLSLAAPASSPALASTHPAPAAPAHQTPAPAHSTAMVREMIPLKYIDCRQAITMMEDSMRNDPWTVAFPIDPQHHGPESSEPPGTQKGATPIPPLPPRLSRIFPAGTQLIPFVPNNALIAISTPDAIALLKRMLKPIDVKPRFILFSIAEVAAPLKELKTIGLHPELATPLTRNGDKFLSYLGNNLNATLQQCLEDGACHLVGRPRLILPGNMSGYVAETTMTPDGLEAGNKIALLGRLNSEGTITVYARIDYEESSGNSGSSRTAGSSTGPLQVPGIRITNGNTFGLLMRLTPPGQLSGKEPAPADSPSISSPERTPGRAPEEHTGDENEDSQCVIYFITPTLVDDHGQIEPGGAEAVRKAWQEDHQQ